MGASHIGTSGYVYSDWRHTLYEGIPQSRWLERYAELFDTVELNATFYRLPRVETVARWYRQTPADFTFVAKGSRFVTHMKRLNDPKPGLKNYFERLRPLRDKLAVVLWQLPPQQATVDLSRLERFLDALPKSVRHAFEVRAPAWYTRPVYELLDDRGVAFCEHDLLEERPGRRTGGFRYLRFHGASAKYEGRYGAKALAPVGASLQRSRQEAYVYFNNDRAGHAVMDAIELLRATRPRAERPPRPTELGLHG